MSVPGGQSGLMPRLKTPRPEDLPVEWEWLDWLAEEHLTPEEVGRYASHSARAQNLESPEDLQDLREMLTLHLRLCESCRDAVRLRRLDPGRRRRTRAAVGSALLILALAVVAFWLLVVSDQRRQWSTPASNGESSPLVPPGPLGQETGSTTPQTGGDGSAFDGQSSPAEDSPRLTLRDGRKRVVLRASGALSGLDELSAADQKMIAQTLLTGELSVHSVTDLTAEEPPRLRSPGALETRPHPTIRLLEPPPSVIISTLPIFRWAPVSSVTGWVIELAQIGEVGQIGEVREVGGGQKLSSPVLVASTRKWQPAEPLRRGTTWQATLRGRTQKDELVSSPRKFRILGERELLWLDDLRRKTRSHLARGLAYARLGLIPEAISELQLLDAANPDNILIKRFLLRLMAESAP